MIPLLKKTAFWSVAILFVLLYPMLVSIYVTLPLFIGYAGYLLLLGIEGRGMRYIVFPLFYLLNLEINLSLPLLLTVMAVLIYYLSLYPATTYIKRCRVCISILTVVAIDLIYLLLIVGYDFVFGTTSIVINSLLLYSLVLDIVAAVLL